MSRVDVSVVMPVLNGMPFVKSSLDSLIEQTLVSIEIIVVDAGSSDGTIEYIFGKQIVDERIKLVHSDKKSMGAQYNQGIDKAKGLYVGFCESDDHCDKNMFLKLFEKAKQYEWPDYVKCDCVDFSEKGNESIEIKIHNLRHHEDKYNRLLDSTPYPGVFFNDVNHWNGIYKREFINSKKIRFNETAGAAAQDAGFISQVLLSDATRVYINDALYYYRQDNPDSSMKSIMRARFYAQELIYLMGLFEKNDYINKPYRFSVVDRLFGGFIGELARELFEKKECAYMNVILELKESLKSFFNEYGRFLHTRENINLFLHDHDRFIEYLVINYEYISGCKKRALYEAFNSSEIVIFGAGELGECLFVYLRNNDYPGRILFCDNRKSGELLRKTPIVSVDEACISFPNGVYIITNGEYGYEMITQLIQKGVDYNNIFLIEGIYSHLSLSERFDWAEQYG